VHALARGTRVNLRGCARASRLKSTPRAGGLATLSSRTRPSFRVAPKGQMQTAHLAQGCVRNSFKLKLLLAEKPVRCGCLRRSPLFLTAIQHNPLSPEQWHIHCSGQFAHKMTSLQYATSYCSTSTQQVPTEPIRLKFCGETTGSRYFLFSFGDAR
jgi:hypothetical protein